MIFNLIYFFRGSVHIKIEGRFIERFINICAYHNVFLWDIVKVDNRCMTMFLSRKAFYEVNRIAEKSDVTVEVLEKKGLPHILSKYKRRKAFAIGGLFFFLATFYMMSLVWHVEVIGNENIPASELLEEAKKNGIRIGVSKRKINTDDVISNIMLERDDLSWAGIYIKGTKLTLHVTERDMPPVVEDDTNPSDIVAKKDGVIQEVIVKAGVANVKKGDSVFKGDLLIKGDVPLKYSGKNLHVHAKGEVYATTWYELKEEVPKVKTVREFTGRTYKRTIIELFGIGIKLPKPVAMPYTEYDMETIEQPLVIGDSIYFPVRSNLFVYKEVQSKEVFLNEEQALEYCVSLIEEKAVNVIPKEALILAKYRRYVYDEDGKKYVEMIFECREDIGLNKVKESIEIEKTTGGFGE